MPYVGQFFAKNTMSDQSTKSQEIELDVPPLQPRPDTLLLKAIEGTGLPIRAASSKIFGCWTFNYDDVDHSLWEHYQPKLKENITRLYDNGHIRYGSW